jgi:thymidylate synthase
MASTVSGDTAVEAWKAASHVVLAGGRGGIRNLITEVETPTVLDPAWLQKYDPLSVGAGDRLSVVAKVLFPPSRPYHGETRDQYYSRWAAVLQRARKTGKLHSSWGSTYFERLLSIGGSDNQIERAIHVLSSWPRREAAIVAHLSAPHLDKLKPIGSPCLQFVELLWGTDDVIDLVAVYRNHDYLNKALGNFIGLGRLLDFIAKESDKSPGKVVCHSVHAYCDSPPKLRALVAR